MRGVLKLVISPRNNAVFHVLNTVKGLFSIVWLIIIIIIIMMMMMMMMMNNLYTEASIQLKNINIY